MTDYRKILIKYGCQVAFVLCVTFNAYWFSTSGNSDAENLVEEICSTQRKIITTSRVRMFEARQRYNDTAKSNQTFYEQVSKNWNVSTSASQAPSYEHIYPSANVTIVFVEEQYKIAVPRQFYAKIAKKNIQLRWKQPQSKNNGKYNMQYDGYQLVKEWRDAKGKRQQKTFHFTNDRTEYLDTQIAFKTDYNYQLRSFTYNTKATGGVAKTILGKEVIASKTLRSKQLRIMPAYEIKLLGAGSCSAMILLRKYYNGKYMKTTCVIREGEMIEALHVKVPGSGLHTDFTPGWKLVKINPRAEILREKIVRVGRKRAKKMVKSYAPAITYLDDEQQQVQLIQNK
ncbi:hypothetical protein [Candidatus Uabimicrobium amorphum]|uniref:Uncharacterized protein n=1 Tax=Uabimicrobium amorphum TaxID=2596890 RepID=A0A5S9IWF1_UABAM|nr:hypothetical protein [Candidatus Uabimicrobium amorphum]BBM87795.1 hypothetical protein UABAM_06210 [Candidatus Uabimicrobium amorphum]